MIQQDENLEEKVVGSLIVYPQTLILIAPILKDEYLYSNKIKIVYRAIIELYKKSIPIDISSVTRKIYENGLLESVGGAYYTTEITRHCDTIITGIEHHCRVIHQLYILRQLTTLGTEITNSSIAPSADPFEIAERINKRLANLMDISTTKIKVVGELFGEMVNELKEVIENGKPTGIMSGFHNLDSQTGGWQKGNLVILAARPGMGKTAFSLSLLKHPSINLNIPTAMFSMEMTALELTGRLASSESYLSSTKINQKKVTKDELTYLGANCSKLIDAPIYIDDTPNLTITALRSKVTKLHYDNNVQLVVVDYLQLMRGEGRGNREQEISEITRGLKTLSKELMIPIIALAQLSRECEKRDDKRPILSDLRESGSIEQDADLVMFIFRPEYYGLFPNGYAYGNETLNTKELMLIDIAKGRAIRTGELPLKFIGEFMDVKNYNLSGYVPELSEVKSKLENNNNFINDTF